MAAGNYSAGPGGGRAPTARPHPYRQRGGRLSDLSAGAGLRIRIGGERRRSCRGRRGGNIERAGRLCGGTARCGTQDIAHRRRHDAAGYAHGLSLDGGGAYGAAEMNQCVKKEMERANTITDVKNQILVEGMGDYSLSTGAARLRLATWLQAIWDKPWAAQMLWWHLCAMAAYACGVFFGAFVPKNRYLAFFIQIHFRPPRIHGGGLTFSLLYFLVCLLRSLRGSW